MTNPPLPGDGPQLDHALTEIDTIDTATRARLARPEALTEAALWYARQGIAVFPITPDGKRPCTRHGLLDATTDTDTINRWWTTNPTANIGLPTGHQFDVIDVDPNASNPAEAYQSLATLRDRGALTHTIGKAATPRPGIHVYIQPTGDRNGAGILPGVDYRGAGGYVLAPPSRINGVLYLWLDALVLT